MRLHYVQAACHFRLPMPSIDHVEEHLPGLQLAFFEIVWPAFDWLGAIGLRPEPGHVVSVQLRASELPTKGDLDDCKRLLRDVLDAAFAGVKVKIHITKDKPGAEVKGWYLGMSPDLFKVIASSHAPWRLERGR